MLTLLIQSPPKSFSALTHPSFQNSGPFFRKKLLKKRAQENFLSDVLSLRKKNKKFPFSFFLKRGKLCQSPIKAGLPRGFQKMQSVNASDQNSEPEELEQAIWFKTCEMCGDRTHSELCIMCEAKKEDFETV